MRGGCFFLVSFIVGCTATSSGSQDVENLDIQAVPGGPLTVPQRSDFRPTWEVGRTWCVRMQDQIIKYKTGGSLRCRRTYRFGLSSIDHDGTAHVAVYDAEPPNASVSPEVELSFSHEGDAMKFGHFLGSSISPNALENMRGGRCIFAWAWPRFPVTPGTPQSFDGGAVTQTSLRQDGTVKITTIYRDLSSNSHREIVTVTEWEEGRPWWTTSNSWLHADELPPEGVWHAGGEVRSWHAGPQGDCPSDPETSDHDGREPGRALVPESNSQVRASPGQR